MKTTKFNKYDKCQRFVIDSIYDLCLNCTTFETYSYIHSFCEKNKSITNMHVVGIHTIILTVSPLKKKV